MMLGLHIVYIHQYTLYPDFIQIFVPFYLREKLWLTVQVHIT